MQILEKRWVVAPAAALFSLSMSSFAAVPTQHADAASSVQALVAEAERNTNSVTTIVHHDKTTITSASATLSASTVGSEDETRNREHDFENVTVTGHGKGAAGKSQHYTLDIIFVNGTTYFRTSLLQNNKWQSRKGTSLQDPYTGTFKRGRTTVTFPKSYVFSQVSASGGQTQVRATFSKGNVAGTVDLWISGGPKPYVVREVQDYHSTKVAKNTGHVDIHFGPYNGSLVILAPTTQGST